MHLRNGFGAYEKFELVPKLVENVFGFEKLKTLKLSAMNLFPTLSARNSLQIHTCCTHLVKHVCENHLNHASKYRQVLFYLKCGATWIH
jgi:hypothetical protein